MGYGRIPDRHLDGRPPGGRGHSWPSYRATPVAISGITRITVPSRHPREQPGPREARRILGHVPGPRASASRRFGDSPPHPPDPCATRLSLSTSEKLTCLYRR